MNKEGLCDLSTINTKTRVSAVVAWEPRGSLPVPRPAEGLIDCAEHVSSPDTIGIIMQIELYCAPYSCALVPYVMLTEANVDFTLRPLNIRGKANMTPEYLALNPKHKVPLLIVDGKSLSENVAIQLWIAQSFPEAQLIPEDRWKAAQAVSLLAWFASGVHPNISRYNAPKKFCDVPGSEEATVRLAGKALLENFALANTLLEGREFLLNTYSSADVYLFWCLRRSGYFPNLDLAQFTNITAHSERLQKRPSLQKAIALDDEVKALFGLTP